MSKNLSKAILEKFECDASAYAFLTNLMSKATVYIFGGAIRDFLDGSLASSRDIDLVIEPKESHSINIEECLKPIKNILYKKNRFDGYKIVFNNCITVDVWNLIDTWAFKTNKLVPSAANLMKSVYLNVDALVYSLNSDSFLNDCDLAYMDIIRSNLIDIVFEDTPYEDLNLLRALVFKKKYSLELSSKLNDRLINYIENNESSIVDSFLSLQMSHYNEILLDQIELTNILCDIEKRAETLLKDVQT